MPDTIGDDGMSRAGEGRRVRVLSVGPDAHGRGGMATVIQQLAEHATAVADLTTVSTHTEGSVPRRVRVFVRGAAHVLAALRAREVDVVHLHVAKRGSIARKAVLTDLAALFGVPVVLHAHGGMFGDDYRRMPRLLQRAVSRTFRRARFVVVLGEHWRDVYVDVVGVPAERVVTVVNAVAVPAAVPPRPASPVRALFLGKLGPPKGIPELVRAVAQVPPELRARLRVTLAGHGDIEETKALVAELGVGDVVEVAGWLGARERDAALAAATLFVLPSRFEALPMSMLEAMAWGAVPIVTPVGGIPEIVVDGQNGLHVAPGDVDAITAALVRLVTDRALTARLSAAARRTAQEHDVTAYVERLAEVWRSAATDPVTRPG